MHCYDGSHLRREGEWNFGYPFYVLTRVASTARILTLLHVNTAFGSDQKWINLWWFDREQLYRFAQLRVRSKASQLESLIVLLVFIFFMAHMSSALDGRTWTQVPLIRHAAVPKRSGVNVRALHGKPDYWQPNKRPSADSSLCGSGQEAMSRITGITIIHANFAAVNSPHVWS